MNELTSQLPPMMFGGELETALTELPVYDGAVTGGEVCTRLTALEDIYKLYIPSQMTVEIYSKLYLSMLRSLEKKETKTAVQQRNENFRRIQGMAWGGIMGGSDSFTIVGSSGIGKSSAIFQSINTAAQQRILQAESPYQRVIPCIICQCPHDCSVKGLLLEILRKVDETLGTRYYEQSIRARATTDMLIGSVSQAALNHVGLLVVDEIQNVSGHKNGRRLVSMLIQLINSSGISICMVGTPESVGFFEQNMQFARRSLGLQYTELSYDGYFQKLCETVFKYQYVRNRTEITEGIKLWLYEHTSGLVSAVIALIHDAQELAIMSGKEVLNIETLHMAYQERMKMLHGYIRPNVITKGQTAARGKHVPGKASAFPASSETDLYALIMENRGKEDIVEVLKKQVCIWEVPI